MDNQGEKIQPSPNVDKLSMTSTPEAQVEIPQASQVNELRIKISSGTATDKDKIALAFSLKEKFKQDFGRVSEQEAILLQEIAQKNNAGQIIDDFNGVESNIFAMNDPVARGLVLELLSYGMKKEEMEDIYKDANWRGANDATVSKLADFFTADSADKSRDYAKGAAMIKFIPKLDFDRKINYAEMAFKNAPTAETRYNWYVFIDESFKNQGKRFEALQFFKENKDFLFKEKIKAAEKARPIILNNFSDLTTPEARENVAFLLNKIYKTKEPVVADDLMDTRLISTEEMTENLKKIAITLDDEKLSAASEEILRFGIPILLSDGKQKIIVTSESLLRKLDIGSEAGGQVKDMRQIPGITPGESGMAVYPLYEDIAAIPVIKQLEEAESGIVSIHESIHVYRFIHTPTAKNITALVGDKILGELQAYYVDGMVPAYILTNNYEQFRTLFTNKYIDPYSESLRTNKQKFQADAATAMVTIQHLNGAGLSAVDVQDVLLNSRTLQDFNEWMKYSTEELKTLFKEDLLKDILRKYSEKKDATFIKFPIDNAMQDELAGYIGKIYREESGASEEFLRKYGISDGVYKQLLSSMRHFGGNPMIDFLQLYQNKIYWQEHSEKPTTDLGKDTKK